MLALDLGLEIGGIANLIAPYRTLGDASKRAAGSYYTEVLLGQGSANWFR